MLQCISSLKYRRRSVYIEQATNRTHPATKNGLWEGQYIYKKERRSIYCRTQEEVSRQLNEIIESIEKGTYIRPNQHTLFSWLMEWLHSYAEPTLRPSTFTNYKMHIERYFNNKLGKVKLKNVSTRMLQNFFNEK